MFIAYLRNDTEEFAVLKLTATSSDYVRSPSEFIGQIKSFTQNLKIIKTDENMTVAGHKAGMIQYAYRNNYVTIIHIKIDEKSWIPSILLESQNRTDHIEQNTKKLQNILIAYKQNKGHKFSSLLLFF